MNVRSFAAHGLIAALVLICPAVLCADDAGWTPLFNGKDLTGWETWLGKPHKSVTGVELEKDAKGNYAAAIGLNRDPLGVYSVATVDGQPAIRISGQVFGAITTTGEFENYHVRLEFKWGTKRWPPRDATIRDSGLLYHCVGPQGAAGSNWMTSLECQIQEGDCGDFWSVEGPLVDVQGTRPDEKSTVTYQPGGKLFTVPSPGVPRRIFKSANFELPSGQWNTVEMLTVGTTAVHLVNGRVNMVLKNSRLLVGDQEQPLAKGKLQIQSEGAEVFYRNIAVRPLAVIPSDYLGP